MESFKLKKHNLDAIISYYNLFQNSSNTGSKYFNLVFQNTSALPSSSDRIDTIGKYLYVTGLILLNLLTLGGNLTIILTVRKSKTLSCTNYSVYIVSLAVADLCVGLLIMPPMVIYTYFGYWPFGNTMCTLFTIIDHGVTTASQVHLSAIAYDRLESVLQPLMYRSTFTRGRTTKICASLWLGTFLFWTPGVVVTRVLKAIDGTMVNDQCYYLPNKYYVLISMSLYYLVTDISLVILALLLVLALRRRYIPDVETNASTGKQHRNTCCAIPQDDDGAIPKTVPSTDRAKKIVSATTLDKVTDQNLRVIRTLVILIVAYGLCLMPWKVFWLILAFCNTCISETAFSISYWLAYANSFVNPYLYFSFNSDFRADFHQAFC